MFLELLTTLPLQVPDPDATAPPGAEQFIAIMGWLKWAALAVCIVGLIIGGAMMAINSRRGEGGEHVGRIGMALAGVVIISAAASLVGFIAS